MRPEPTWNGGACAFADGGVHCINIEGHIDQVHLGEVGEAAIGRLNGSTSSHLLGADHGDQVVHQGDVFSGFGVSNTYIDEITEGDRCGFETMQVLEILPKLACNWVWIIDRL